MSANMRKCKNCGCPNPSSFDTCYNCKSELSVTVPEVKVKAKRERKPISIRVWIGLALILVLAVLGFCANYHIVSSSEGFMVIPKEAFTLKETYIVVEEIKSMPAFAAKSRYPLSIRALQREGILESDEERRRRIEEEVDREIQKEVEKLESEQSSY